MSVADASIKPMTLAEFVELPDSDHMELVDGIPVEKQMAVAETFVAGKIGFYLELAQVDNAIGHVGPETLVNIGADNPSSCRRPDVCFISFERLGDSDLAAPSLDVCPEIVVEVVSPNDVAFEVDRKIEEYLSAGAQMVLEVNSDLRRVMVHRPESSPEILRNDELLTAPGILPDLRVPVSKLFPPTK